MKNFLNLRRFASNQRESASRGFTLLELLVVISIIGLLSTIALVSLDSARKKTRDTQRLSDMAGIQKALLLYKEANGFFPGNTDNNDSCASWDVGYSGDGFITPLQSTYFTSTPKDPLAPTSGCGGKGTANLYLYKYFIAGDSENGCPAGRGNYYVLGVRNMETVSSGQHPKSPEFGVSECSGNNWATQFEWYAGAFEK